MKLFITKYALSSGIVEVEMPDPRDGNNYVYGRLSPDHMDGIWYLDREAFADRDAALKNAEDRRTKKIASLKKQIAALEKLTFA